MDSRRLWVPAVLVMVGILALAAPVAADTPSRCQVHEVLGWLNRGELTTDTLKDAGVHTRAAKSIVGYRAGLDGEMGTDDDVQIDYWDELDGLPQVGPKALEQLAGAVSDRCPPAGMRLGAWNIKKLGHGSSKDYGLVARIIDETFDVLAVVEVMQKGGTHPGYEKLLKALQEVSPDTWEAAVTTDPRPNTGAGHAEFYAVFWRAGVARRCEGQTAHLVYLEDNDGGAEGTGFDVFSREPAYLCLVAGDFDFFLGVYHALHEDKPDLIQDEVEHVDWVFMQMMAERQDEWDLLLAGDFNLRPDDLGPCTQAIDWTDPKPSTLNSEGGLSDNAYDHLLVRWKDEAGELRGKAEVLDVRYYADSARDFFETVSDHLPIRVIVNIPKEDDD